MSDDEAIAPIAGAVDVMREIRQLLERMDLNAVIVSAIIEREHAGETQVLVQTRWKPTRDPEYSGTLEIPAGGIHAYENVYERKVKSIRRSV